MSDDRLRCSFCGRRSGEGPTTRVIQGPAVTICNNCVELCQELLQEEGIVSVPLPDPPDSE